MIRTASQAAVGLLLRNDQRGLTRLAQQVDRAILDAHDPACLDCGARGQDDNCCEPEDLNFTLLCRACGNQHSPNI